MFILPFALSLVSSAFAADPMVECAGVAPEHEEECVRIQYLVDRVEALEATCSQVCSDDAPAPAAKKPASGPSKTYQVLDAYGKRLAELEALTKGGVVSDTELGVELDRIQGELDGIDATLQDHEDRIAALEAKASASPVPAVPAPLPPAMESVPGPRGRDGADGRDGRDGRPAEIAVLAGATGLHSPEWDIVGAEMGLRIGGRPLSSVSLGGYASGMFVPTNWSTLGFGVGGYIDVEAASWFLPGLAIGWSEVGIDLTTTGARRVVQGVEGTVNLQFRPTRAWVLEGSLGAHFGAEATALTWGVSTGFRF